MIDYNLHYVVKADTRLEAIAAAVGLLRTGVKLRGVLSATPTAGEYWDVTLSVEEDV